MKTTLEDIDIVMDLIRDPQRIDRYIRRQNGRIFCTDADYQPCVRVAAADEPCDEDDLVDWAHSFIGQLDERIAAALDNPPIGE